VRSGTQALTGLPGPLHQCTGSGPGFCSGTEFASLADQYGFIVIYPSVTRSGSCWDVSSRQALTRNGGSDPVGIMSMITYAEQHYGGNPNRVYVTGACHVTYTKSSEWTGGFVANITIGNTGSAPVNGWQLAFTFRGDQRITSEWNATVSQNGSSVTAANASYDGTISPGGSVSVGFQGTWTSNDTAPTSFSLNGTACS
jgi:cellulase/cellobiase CelA1